MNIDIVRAWKDRGYREGLSDEEQALLPENPVGQIELTDDELKEVSGAQAQTGGGGFNSFGLGCSAQSQQGVCQSVGGSVCQSQQGGCQSLGGNCPSQSGRRCTSFSGIC